MRFESTDVDGAFLVDIEPREDERGFFARAWCTEEFAAHGIEPAIVQINNALTRVPSTIRGLHWQSEPHGEAKFMRCIRGEAFDVCADVRRDSPTFGKWVGVRLDGSNRRALFVPGGCAHGYQALEPDTELLYTTSAPYVSDAERGMRWNDPMFDIDWPLDPTVISEKDQSWPDFA